MWHLQLAAVTGGESEMPREIAWRGCGAEAKH